MKGLLSDTWFPECFFLIFSWAIFITNIVLLRVFDGKPLFSWLGLGLNTVVSTLSTASKSSLLFVISSCIGQWTYILFSQSPTPVIHFDTHDSASRGPWGSVQLLWRYRRRLYRSPPALGAALVVLSLFVDPFFQQVIAFGERQTEDITNTVQIPRAMRYSKGLLLDTFGTVYDTKEVLTDFSMQAAMRSGLASPNAKFKAGARCPSTTCEWEKYKSLAVCNTCTDITSKLAEQTLFFNTSDAHAPQVLQLKGNDEALMLQTGPVHFHYLPNGLYMEREQANNLQLEMVISSTYNSSDTISFKNEPHLLWSVAAIRSKNASEGHFTALECGLSLCIQEIESKSINGSLKEESSKIDVAVLQDSLQVPTDFNQTDENGKILPDPQPGHFVTTTTYPRKDLIFEGNFSISQTSINSIARGLQSLFFEDVTTIEYIQTHTHTNGTFHGNISRKVPNGYYININNNASAKYKPSPMQILNSAPDFGPLFDDVAESMTNNIRQEDDNATVVHGTSAIVIYKIRWVYIILPAIFTTGGVIFLLLSAWHTHHAGVPLWKSSAVAILKCGATLEGFAQNHSQVSKMDAVGESTSLRLSDFKGESTQRFSTFEQSTRYTPIGSEQPVRMSDIR